MRHGAKTTTLLRHSCAASCSARPTPVALEDSPLSFASTRAQSADDVAPSTAPAAASRGKTAGRLSAGVALVVDLVAGFQSAYVSAALFSVTVSAEGYASRARSNSSSSSSSSSEGGEGRTLMPPGYRVSCADISVFTAPDPAAPGRLEYYSEIQLISPFPPAAPKCAAPARAASTASLKAAVQPLTTSPHRPRTPPAQLSYRMRPVSNPVLLRLRALQNVLAAHNAPWEGRGREGGLGCGREKMLGICYEGRTRSGLGCEVRVGVG